MFFTLITESSFPHLALPPPSLFVLFSSFLRAPSALHNDLIWQARWQASESNTEGFPPFLLSRFIWRFLPNAKLKSPDSISSWHNNRISLILSYINYSAIRAIQRERERFQRKYDQCTHTHKSEIRAWYQSNLKGRETCLNTKANNDLLLYLLSC